MEITCGNGMQRCRGVVVQLEQRVGRTEMKVWCQGYGVCPIWPDSVGAERNNLRIGCWYDFGLVYSSTHKAYVADATSAQLIQPGWPTATKLLRAYLWSVEVKRVLAVVGSMQAARTIAFSGFFQRILVSAAVIADFFQESDRPTTGTLLHPGMALLLDIAKTPTTDGCSWSAIRLEQLRPGNEATLKEIGARQVVAKFISIEEPTNLSAGNTGGRVWLMDTEGREKIYFGQCDFHGEFDLQQIKNHSNGLFKACIGENRPTNGAFSRSFCVELLHPDEHPGRSLPVPMVEREASGKTLEQPSQLDSFMVAADNGTLEQNINCALTSSGGICSVQAVLGALQGTENAIAYSPLFQRILIDADAIAQFSRLSAPLTQQSPVILLLDIVKVKLHRSENYAWQATRIHAQWPVTDKEMLKLGICQLPCLYVTEDSAVGLYWLVDADRHSKVICFIDDDFTSHINPRSFKQGDRFTAWIGERQGNLDHFRAFFVKRDEDSAALASCAMSASSSDIDVTGQAPSLAQLNDTDSACKNCQMPSDRPLASLQTMKTIHARC